MTETPETCLAFDEDLSAWLDGELEAARAAAVAAHVKGCPRCSARVDSLRAVDRHLRALADDATGLAARQARLRAGLAAAAAGPRSVPARASRPARDAAEPPSRVAPTPRRRRALAGLLAAAAAAALVLLVVPRLLEHPPAPSEIAAQRPPEPAAPAVPPLPIAPGQRRIADTLGTPSPSEAMHGASAAPEPGHPEAGGTLARTEEGGAPSPTAPAPGAAATSQTLAAAEPSQPAPTAPSAVLARLEAASDEDLALAMGLGEVDGVGSADDIEMIRHLDALEALDARGAGRG
jgi:hypothetical protein